jgi:phosphatidylglycerol---prolipoprotein diacylglyceryl transferase
MPPLYLLPFPEIDPVAFSIGPLAVRWYALAYVFGLLLALAYAKRLVRRPELWGAAGPPVTPHQLDDFLLWATLGVVVGGRLGYVLFYNLPHYSSHPLAILEVWHGGMSFHGGFLGVIAASWLFSRSQRIPLDRLLDVAVAGVPIGLGLGRLANFINGELYGRPTSLPWAMVFPNGGPEPRHPSQLYEALLEGLVLFIVIKIATDRYHALVRPGLVAGIFALGYGLARFFVEFFREPDAQIGPVIGFLTAGMLLSVPLMVIGIWLIHRARKPK